MTTLYDHFRLNGQYLSELRSVQTLACYIQTRQTDLAKKTILQAAGARERGVTSPDIELLSRQLR